MSDTLEAVLLQLVNIESVSGNEAALTEWIAERALEAGMLVHARAGDWIVYGPPRTGLPLMVIAGHSDTVPAQGNLPGRVEDGWVHGLGAADMKAGLAVQLELGRRLGAATLARDIAFLVFGHEELRLADSLLPRVFAECPLVREAALVVMMEPTANVLHAGCLGNIVARVDFAGVAAHSARPWLGRNAIHDAVRGLARLVDAPVNDVELDGLTFREVVSVTTIEGGVANNVVPDRVSCGVNFRYAASRTPAAAEARLRVLAGPDVELTVLSNAPGAPVSLANPHLQALRAAGDLEVAPKQAWTPVAEFAAAGLDAINFGPGDPEFAHRRDERASVAAMRRSYEVMWEWLRR